MFQVGDYMIYGNSGICKVMDIGCPQKVSIDNDRLYYTLRPVFSTEVIYTPVDTKTYMRAAMTKRQALDLIDKIPEIKEAPVSSKTKTALKEEYENSIQAHKSEALVRLIKGIKAKNTVTKNAGKQINQLDQRYMRLAETLLYGELAVALGIPREKVLDYIKSSIVSKEA